MDLVCIGVDINIKYCWVCLYNNDTNIKTTLFITSFVSAKDDIKEFALPISYKDRNTLCKITAYEAIPDKNNTLYSNLGYQRLGQIYFRDQSEMPFNCYEKPLK